MRIGRWCNLKRTAPCPLPRTYGGGRGERVDFERSIMTGIFFALKFLTLSLTLSRKCGRGDKEEFFSKLL
jgi:hypothetical protein